ncbi:DUF4350 domain-containing protein [Planotetraspora kaengkrachanensis]|uniref:DUF4350 domain-containing protein n=1 Tax=Planotetraspora kaengkrachanensis TaxID=575193 RepID=A0A8J3PV82_9ACTN|nr:DUF4350 domain-containing protein [Planotetraspora kaengkrachanensis]GIG81683.1 hypothetical protein Pka01_48100 [Planotetraspora kaengkrachanensis]
MTLQTAERSFSVSPTARGVWRRGRAIVLVGAIVVIAAVVPLLLPSGSPQGGTPLDPGDSSLVGSRALAQVLGAHGVEVRRVGDVATALAAAGPDSQLLITDSVSLTQGEAGRIAAAPADRLIVGDVPHLDVLARGLTAEIGGTRSRSRAPECGLREATQAGDAYMGGTAFTAPPGSTGCYPSDGKPTLVRYVVDGHTVTVVGDGQFMTNLRLAEDGNAALATNLAGTKQRLIWLVPPAQSDQTSQPSGPDGSDGSGSEPKSIGDLIPGGVGWAVLELVIAVGLVALWRGRRLGPVVAERLPVVVRAAETVEGRGRLYRARRARDRAAIALRAATTDRITPRLGLPRTATPDEIVTAVSVRTGVDPGQVRQALYGGAPADDAGLVALAGFLDTLERQVQDS